MPVRIFILYFSCGLIPAGAPVGDLKEKKLSYLAVAWFGALGAGEDPQGQS
jgi:hypothetical protein